MKRFQGEGECVLTVYDVCVYISLLERDIDLLVASNVADTTRLRICGSIGIG